MEDLCGIPVLGIIPYYRDIHIEEEDSVVLDYKRMQAVEGKINIAVVLLRHLSNFTDFNRLERDERVHLYYTNNTEELAKADIILLPGSKSTLDDLYELRRNGVAQAVLRAHREGAAVMGICGGYQLMGLEVHDPGSRVAGGIKIKKGKLRGIESRGMMCSIEELGSNRDMYPEAPEEGIYIFPADAEVGTSAVEALGLNDVVFEYEITSNRVDCFSVVGIAREAAATFRKEFRPPVVTETGNDEDVNNYIKVTVQDNDLCPRYCARVVKNIKIGPSPKWMQRRLASVGIRPINNLVDITNYVMEEYGMKNPGVLWR